jgi:hypothetical protein
MDVGFGRRPFMLEQLTGSTLRFGLFERIN